MNCLILLLLLCCCGHNNGNCECECREHKHDNCAVPKPDCGCAPVAPGCGTNPAPGCCRTEGRTEPHLEARPFIPYPGNTCGCEDNKNNGCNTCQ